VARSARGFVQACERVLSESVEQRCVRALDMLTTVSTQSWDRTADVVHRLLLAALPAPAAVQPPHTAAATAALPA
jgi:hypothetical protein